ncbi:MAG: hypothetical protein ABI221_01185 [Candidatus Saccharimonadales bacterium]
MLQPLEQFQSREQMMQLIACDPRIVNYLRYSVSMGRLDERYERDTALAIMVEHGVDFDTFTDACALALAANDEAVFSGEINLL